MPGLHSLQLTFSQLNIGLLCPQIGKDRIPTIHISSAKNLSFKGRVIVGCKESFVGLVLFGDDFFVGFTSVKSLIAN